MSSQPIDPSGILKRLFDRSPRRGNAPRALFQREVSRPDSGLPPKPGPAVAPDSRRRPSAVTVQLRRLGEALRGLRNRPQGERTIGVDLGHASVKVVRIEADHGRGPQVTGVAVEDFSAEVGEGPAWEQAVQEAIRAVQQRGLMSGPVVMGFHHLDSLVEFVRLPKMPPPELEKAILWEAREKFSLTPEKMVIRHLVLGETAVEGQPQTDLLVVAAPKEPILSRWRILSDLGLKVAAAEPVGLAAFYALAGDELWKPEELVGVLEIGLKVSHLSFVRGDAVRFTRAFPVGGDSFTRSIADYCQLEYGDAERLKRQYGISKMALEEDRQQTGHEADDRVRISHALGLHLEQLVAEIEQSFRYFTYALGGSEAQRMDRLLVTGGGGLLKYLAEFLNTRLSIPVEAADPLRHLEVAPEVREQLVPGLAQRLSVPVGLALRRMK